MTKTLFAGMTFLVAVFGIAGSTWAIEIAGNVVDETGKPVADATVVVQAPDQFFFEVVTLGTSKSDVYGKYSISLPKLDITGNCQLFAIHPNYGVAIPYVFNLEQEGSLKQKIVMLKRGFIQGKVVDCTGKPVNDAEITVFLKKTHRSHWGNPVFPAFLDKAFLSTKTDTNGDFKLDGLPQDNTVIVRVKHPDYVIGIAGLLEVQKEIIGAIKVGSSDICVTLQPGSSIKGRVVRKETGLPITHVTVMANPVTPAANNIIDKLDRVEPSETDDNGTYEIRNLASGKYVIGVGPIKTLGYISVSRTIEVVQIGRMTGQDFSVVNGIRIAGKFIKEDTKEPVCGGDLFFTGKGDPTVSAICLTKSDGLFETQMPPGEVEVWAYGENNHLQERRTLTLIAGHDETNLVFVELAPLIFKGRVLDMDGKSITGAKVVTKYDYSEPVTSSSEGLFEYHLPDYMNFRRGSTLMLTLEASHPEKPGLRGILIKKAASRSDLTGDIVLVPTGTIRGKVVNTNGNPISSTTIRVSIKSEDGSKEEYKVHCDKDGLFEIKDVLVGVNYSLMAYASKYREVYADYSMTDPGTTWDVGTLMLTLLDKTIDGMVVDETGVPISGVRLTCFDNGIGAQTLSRNDGHFQFEKLADEKVHIKAWYKDSKGERESTVSARGGDTNVKVILKNR